jgi:FkbM family methyltransferase
MQRLLRHLIVNSPKRIVDIGANVGDFSKSLHSVFPQCQFCLVEANENCEPNLKALPFSYDISALGAEESEADFYIENVNPLATGASLKRENTAYYNEGLYHTKKVKIHTLDSKKYFAGETINLLKLDVQGSELDILRGGKETLKRTDLVLLECSNVPYNLGAPLIDEAYDYMEQHGFGVMEIVDFVKMQIGIGTVIGQMDILFKKI